MAPAAFPCANPRYYPADHPFRYPPGPDRGPIPRTRERCHRPVPPVHPVLVHGNPPPLCGAHACALAAPRWRLGRLPRTDLPRCPPFSRPYQPGHTRPGLWLQASRRGCLLHQGRMLSVPQGAHFFRVRVSWSSWCVGEQMGQPIPGHSRDAENALGAWGGNCPCRGGNSPRSNYQTNVIAFGIIPAIPAERSVP